MVLFRFQSPVREITVAIQVMKIGVELNGFDGFTVVIVLAGDVPQ